MSERSERAIRHSGGPGLQAVRVVGGLVPPGLFARIQSGEMRQAESVSSRSYHLPGRETVRDAANRSWTYLRGAWRDWREHAAAQPPGSPGTGPARERWLLVLLRELGYGQLPALRGGVDVDGAEYPVSHAWQHVPVHLLGPGVALDRRNPGVAGAARAPQAMVQELLNRADEHLWALLSNGTSLRLLRDSTALAGSAYVEFDLEAIFEGELFAEFLLLWQVCHVSRLEKRGGTEAPAADCWLEAWRDEAVDSGTRALKDLRVGVQKALVALGSGFLRHPDNGWLVESLRSGALSTQDYHRALLRLAYRLLFLSVAEDRGVLLHEATPQAADRYARYFSVGRLRRLSRVRAGGPHGDLWQGLQVVFRALGGDGLPALGLPALAGLFDPNDEPLDWPNGTKVDHLLGCSLANTDLLTAMRSLGWIWRGERVQPVDYRNLGSEELGSVYESLLELVPRLDIDEHTFELEEVAGNERKTTGSYYTPSNLVSALLDSALDPLLDDAVKNAQDADDAVARLLRLTVCDPACGSGHFLVAAARRIARRVAQLQSGEDEPTPHEVQHWLREVVGHCIYGVDANPFAAELAKVSLWMEALEPGKPLGFLDARIRVGNSLLGTTPALLAGEVPDEAFKELEGDDKKIAAATRKRNKAERGGQYRLEEVELVLPNTELAKHREPLLALADGVATVREQAGAWHAYLSSDEQLQLQRAQADAWCAAFVWNLAPGGLPAPTSGVVRGFLTAPGAVDAGVRAEVARLGSEYRFFHWHLEFPEIFAVSGADDPAAGSEGWAGGFSCLLGNPPFLNRLKQETTPSTGISSLLQVTTENAMQAYTDASAIFLDRGARLVSKMGYIGFVQPQSLLAARDTKGVRSAIARKCALTDFWYSPESVFEASVVTCAPTLQRGGVQRAVRRTHGANFASAPSIEATTEQLRASEWSFLIASELGIPHVALRSPRAELREMAECTADFRDQYYGLVGFVVDSRPAMRDGDFPPLITTGLIEPIECLWGAVPTRFGKVTWLAPRVDLAALSHSNPEMGRWANSRLVPKVLLATQGKVLEPVVDECGAWIPSVPVITISTSVELLWDVAAVLLSPVVCAYAAAKFAGTGLSVSSIKLSASQVGALPLPINRDSWREAAESLRNAGSSFEVSREEEILDVAGIMCDAYDQPREPLLSWWAARANLLRRN